MIARDRAGAYAEGASRGAPEAVQVADCWHLLQNLTDAVERALLGRSALLAEAARAVDPAPPDDPAPVAVAAPHPTRAERAKADRRERRLARYREVIALRARGVSKRRIAREVGLSVRTVRRWLAADGFPERNERAPQGSKLDPYWPYLESRIGEGVTNASELFRELRARGYRGGVSTAHRAYVEALAGISSEVALVRTLASEFRRMLQERDVRSFGAWVEAAGKSLLRSFAHGLHADAAAIRGACRGATARRRAT